MKTWTTDAIYRETADLVRLRKKQGCKVVEMESAAFFAIAKFRNVQFGQLLYGGDSVHESGWDDREWSNRDTIREEIILVGSRIRAWECSFDMPEILLTYLILQTVSYFSYMRHID